MRDISQKGVGQGETEVPFGFMWQTSHPKLSPGEAKRSIPFAVVTLRESRLMLVQKKKLENSWSRDGPRYSGLKERVKLFLKSQWFFTWKQSIKMMPRDLVSSRSKSKIGLKGSPVVCAK